MEVRGGVGFLRVLLQLTTWGGCDLVRSGSASTSVCPRWAQAWGRQCQGLKTPPRLASCSTHHITPLSTNLSFSYLPLSFSALGFLFSTSSGSPWSTLPRPPPLPLRPMNTHTCSHAEFQTQRHKAFWSSTNLYSPSSTLLGLWLSMRPGGLPGGGTSWPAVLPETAALTCTGWKQA